MSDRDSNLNRRTFVKTGVGVAAGAALGRAGLAGTGTEAPSPPRGLLTVKLPRPGAFRSEVPIFGCGCAPLVRHLRKGEPEIAKELVRTAYDKGLRFFDSACQYRIDPVVGEAIRDFRKDIYIATKTHAIGPDCREVARKHVETERQRYDTDVLDCVKVHTPLEYDYAMAVVDVLEEYKAKGIIRNIGTSQHIHFEVLYRMVDTGRLDEILVARGYFPKGMVELVSQRNAEFREMAIARADDLGMNITGMKSLCSNIFSADNVNVVPDYPEDKRRMLPAAAIRWAFSDPRFHVYAIGVTRHSDIDENIATCSGDMTVTDEDRVLLAEYSTRVWGSEAVKKMEEPLKYADSPFYVEAPLRDLWRGVWGKDGPSGWKG